MVTITRHVFIYIFQTERFSAVKLAMGYEKNMSFLVIAKSPKVWKKKKVEKIGLGSFKSTIFVHWHFLNLKHFEMWYVLKNQASSSPSRLGHIKKQSCFSSPPSSLLGAASFFFFFFFFYKNADTALEIELKR